MTYGTHRSAVLLRDCDRLLPTALSGVGRRVVGVHLPDLGRKFPSGRLQSFEGKEAAPGTQERHAGLQIVAAGTLEYRQFGSKSFGPFSPVAQDHGQRRNGGNRAHSRRPMLDQPRAHSIHSKSPVLSNGRTVEATGGGVIPSPSASAGRSPVMGGPDAHDLA